jgi:amidase
VTEATATDLMFRPVTELAELVRSGEISARELVEASLERIEALNPEINAFVDVFGDEALAEADGIGTGDERPFAGVPIAIKNNRAVAGKRLTMAAEFMGDFAPDYDSNVVRRIKDAGFVIVGTTTLPEWGIVPVTETRRFGPTRNPWDTDRTPGGSSGGSGAAVAAGMVPVAHGNDGGGSTRIPAACCGLVGLKPQRGRISMAPEIGDQFLVTDGVLTRTVAETAQLLDILAGYELGDATWAPEPSEPFAKAAGRAPGKLRIATTKTPPLEADVHPFCAAAVDDVADLLRSLGHEVEEVVIPWDQPGTLETFTAVFGPAVCLAIFIASMALGREPTQADMEPLSWEIWQICQGINAVQGMAAEVQLEAMSRIIIGSLDAYDALITPALAERPVPIGEIDTCSETPMEDFARSGRFTPFTALFNVSGQPAISLPFAHGDDGLPTGIQVVGRPAAEGDLLALAAQIEEARPWADRRPEMAQ